MKHFSDTAPQSQIQGWERLWELLLSPPAQEKKLLKERLPKSSSSLRKSLQSQQEVSSDD